MSRSTKPAKPYIVVFCEGESEQAYTDFLRKEFKDVASIHRPKATGLFDVADSKYKKDTKYRDYAEVTDEVWFFFDVETKDISLSFSVTEEHKAKNHGLFGEILLQYLFLAIEFL